MDTFSLLVEGVAVAATSATALYIIWGIFRTLRSRGDERESKALPHTGLVSVDELSKDQVETIMKVAHRCRALVKQRGSTDILKGKILANLFFEPSTRTRCSFEAAMKRLGGDVVSILDVGNSSVSKGETLEDTIMMMCSYSDAIVIRHPKEGSAVRAVKASSVPVLNAGDGTGEHPTQALLDFFTISWFFPYLLDNELGQPLRVGCVGDLRHGRTVHSLVKLLSRYNVYLRYVAPDGLEMPDELQQTVEHMFRINGLKPDGRQTSHRNIREVLDKVDVLYMTRVQAERFSNKEEYERFKSSYILTSELLDEFAPQHCKVLHPLPRVNEIHPDVDRNHRQAYFEQAQNGLYVRMALLSIVFGKSQQIR